MRIFELDNQVYYLTIFGVSKYADNRLQYDVRLNDITYSLAKSIGNDDCEQLDCQLQLTAAVKKQILRSIADIESMYKKNPSVDFVNKETQKLFSISHRAMIRR